MKQIKVIVLLIVLALFTVQSCKREPDMTKAPVYNPQPYPFQKPFGFPNMVVPADNPLTIQGVDLGRHLFYEKRLSGNNTLSCAGCHMQQFAFTDTARFSIGIDGIAGTRQSMVLQNLGWMNSFFWDGRAATLEEQVLEPVSNPIEMHQQWTVAITKLKADNMYRRKFFEAFGQYDFDSTHAAKAMAQFLRTLVSANSKYDKYLRGELILTSDEFAGLNSFNSLTGADCFHCHGGILFTDNFFHNNGKNLVHTDAGFGEVTGNANDVGKFKAPTLRNIQYSAPYMHDGTMPTLDSVINFYSFHVNHGSPNISPLMEFSFQGGVQLNAIERMQLKAFLLTLSDSEFISNPKFSNPFTQ
ncbi:MAG: cytochrome-c peroxidase [Flavobacteriales bacterium]